MRIKNGRRGSILLTVLAVMTMLAVLAMGGLTLTSAAHRTAVTRHEQTQAYYTAKSALDGVAAYLVHADADDALVSKIAALAVNETLDTSSISWVGSEENTYSVAVTKQPHDYVRIEAMGEYRSGKATTSVMMKVEKTEAPVFQGFFSATGLDGRPTKALENGGTIFLKGNTYFNNGDTPLVIAGSNGIEGVLVNKGKVKLTGGALMTADSVVIGTDSIEIASVNGHNLKGTIVTQKDVSIQGISNLNTQAIYAGGNVKISNVGGYIHGDLYVNGNLNTGSSNTKFSGDVYVNGSITGTGIFEGNVFEGAGAWNQVSGYESYTNVSNNYVQWNYDESEVTDNFYNIQLGIPKEYDPATAGYTPEYVITDSGTLQSYYVDEWQGEYALVVDASDEDIYLKIPRNVSSGGQNFRLGNKVSLKIRGDHNVFLVLDGGGGWDAQSNYYDVGVREDGRSFTDEHPPQLYLISNDNSENVTIDLGNAPNTFYGYIYAPKSIFKCNNGSYGMERLLGGVVAGSFEISNGRFAYIKPPEQVLSDGLRGGTPIDPDAPGTGSSVTFTPIYYSE